MIKKNMLKEYLRYILPTMLTFTLASVYSIVDGMFVGHAVGDAGVAGINVAFPLVAFVMAVGTGIGMGGGVISSIARGAGDEAKSRRAVGTTFVMLLAAALPVMALLLFAAYAVVSYTACVIQMLIQGVGDGSQPLISKHYGAGDADGVRRFRNTNYLITISLGALGLLAMYLLRNLVPLVFGSSAETAAIVAYALPIFSMAYVFYGFTHASTSYFYAVDDARASNAIVYGEAVLVVLVVFGIVRVAGVDGIWFSVTIVQMMLACATWPLLRYRHRRRAAQAAPAPQPVGEGC